MIDFDPRPPVPQLLDPEFSFVDGPGNALAVRKEQIISPALLKDNHELRLKTEREREFMHVAAIPTIFVEKWAKEGFNILTDRNITTKQIVARLKTEGLDQFLTTNKRV